MIHGGLYVLGPNNEVLPADNLEEWYNVLKDINKRRVSLDNGADGKWSVSTVFLGIDHSFCGTKLVFESLVEEVEDRYYVRYSTWKGAERGHKILVKQLKEKYK